MGLKDGMTGARERRRQEKEIYEAQQRRAEKSMQLRSMGIVVRTPGGELSSSITEADLDAMIEAEEQRRSELYNDFVRVGTVTTFRALGVQVLTGGDTVYTIGYHDGAAKSNASRRLGLLAGAQAQVTDGTSAFSLGRAVLMPLALAPLARKETSDALIAFADGTVHTVALDGSQPVRDARKQCVQFNALAGASTQAPVASEADADDPATRLRKLQELLDAGLVSQEEFDTKRQAIIDSI